MEFTNFKRELQTLNYAELNYLISDIMLEIKKRSFNEGMVKAMTSFGSSAEEEAPTKSPQQLRDEIVEKAKRDITELKCKYNCDYVFNTVGVNAEYIINKTKRTVVCLLRGYVYRNRIYSRGIAKCDPTDCFNVHIGKAIALRRALGVEVPTEYLNAPQPTEVRVGDVVRFNDHPETPHLVDEEFAPIICEPIHNIPIGYTQETPHQIIDDSREGVTE
jgi:hypothetical protein